MKKKLSIFLFSCLLLMAFTGLSAQAQGIYPDVNGDGDVTIMDVTKLINYLLSGESGNGVPFDGSTRGRISAKDYGAIGDGVTDDTEALERAFADAARLKVALYIPEGTYMIRRSLPLKSGMEVYGDGFSTVIKKKAAVWHTLTEVLAVDTDVAVLDDVEGFEVGDAMYVSNTDGNYNNGKAAARDCSYGVITAVDRNNKTVKFKSSLNHTAGHSGAVKNHPVGCVLSTSYAIFRSWSKDECIGVYIHDICLDGNRQHSEPMSWCNACIHFDPYATANRLNVSYDAHTYNHIITGCRIINSSFDAISDQGEGGLYVKDCVIENSAMHGVHMGTVFKNAFITGNVMTGNADMGAGVFFCQGVSNVIVEDNTISSFNHGCSDEEYGSAGSYAIIRNNQFNNIKGYVFDFMKATSSARGGSLLITGNTVSRLKSALFAGTCLDEVMITKNIVKSIGGTPSTIVRVTKSNDVIIVGNTLPSSASMTQPVTATDVTNLIQSGNSWD